MVERGFIVSARRAGHAKDVFEIVGQLLCFVQLEALHGQTRTYEGAETGSAQKEIETENSATHAAATVARRDVAREVVFSHFCRRPQKTTRSKRARPAGRHFVTIASTSFVARVEQRFFIYFAHELRAKTTRRLSDRWGRDSTTHLFFCF